MESRTLSIALHAFLSALLAGRYGAEKPNATAEERKEFLAARMGSLIDHIMHIYPEASAIDDIAALATLYKLDCDLVLTAPEVIH